jgi:histidinol-phosphate aminotransferase
VAQAVRKTQVPFSVSALAQECAIAALADLGEVRRRAAETVTERERVAAALRHHGYDVPDSEANFVWLSIGDDAVGFTERCAAAQILVRPFPGEGVRVTIGLPGENDAFLRVATRDAVTH